MANPSQPLALGPLVRIRGLRLSQLPAHPTLASFPTVSARPALREFLSALLAEGHSFIDDYLPAAFTVKSSQKRSPPSAAPVELLQHTIRASAIPPSSSSSAASPPPSSETWFARTSLHADAAVSGSASWAEFDAGLRADHSVHEAEYTPSVVTSNRVCDWRDELQSQLPAGSELEGGWTDLDVALVEMVHRVPSPLQNRVFPLLVVTAKRAAAGSSGSAELLVVQVPVDMSELPEATHSRDSRLTTGAYCSVERADLVPGEGADAGAARVRWQMATASDAKGGVPMWMQKLGVPGAIVKDVGWFIGWCDKRRQGSAGEAK